MGLPKKLLVVEDETVVREGLRSEISGWGYHVDALPDGRKVLDSYSPGQYDAILMDTDMGDGQLLGYQVCKSIRKVDTEIVIIGTSMSVEDDKPSKWYEAGANFFLPKGRFYCELKNTLERCLKNKL